MKQVATLLVFAFATILSSCGDDDDNTLGFVPDVLPSAQIGIAYSATITVVNASTLVGEISIANGALPPGLDFHYKEIEDSARITGTPEAVGTFDFTIEAWCMGTNKPGQTGEIVYSIEVRE